MHRRESTVSQGVHDLREDSATTPPCRRLVAGAHRSHAAGRRSPPETPHRKTQGRRSDHQECYTDNASRGPVQLPEPSHYYLHSQRCAAAHQLHKHKRRLFERLVIWKVVVRATLSEHIQLINCETMSMSKRGGVQRAHQHRWDGRPESRCGKAARDGRQRRVPASSATAPPQTSRVRVRDGDMHHRKDEQVRSDHGQDQAPPQGASGRQRPPSSPRPGDERLNSIPLLHHCTP
jgi:hypothetical protein